MKKVLLVLLAVLVLLVSCSDDQSLFYYGYFSDKAVLVAYSVNKDTVYDITLPLDEIINWGIENGVENIPSAIKQFMGFPEQDFMLGSSDSLKGLYAINNVVKDDISVLRNDELLENISKLCTADFSLLAKSITKNTTFAVMDASNFATGTDINQNREFYHNWVKQLLGE